MHFLARISVYEDKGLNSLTFQYIWLRSIFNIDILRLYNELKKIRNYKDFEKNKILIRRLVML